MFDPCRPLDIPLEIGQFRPSWKATQWNILSNHPKKTRESDCAPYVAAGRRANEVYFVPRFNVFEIFCGKPIQLRDVSFVYLDHSFGRR